MVKQLELWEQYKYINDLLKWSSCHTSRKHFEYLPRRSSHLEPEWSGGRQLTGRWVSRCSCCHFLRIPSSNSTELTHFQFHGYVVLSFKFCHSAGEWSAECMLCEVYVLPYATMIWVKQIITDENKVSLPLAPVSQLSAHQVVFQKMRRKGHPEYP